MSSLCCYCQRLFTRADNRVRHEKHSCQSSGSEKTREVLKVTFPTEKNHGTSSGLEMAEVFRFKTPSSILIVGPSGCDKTCFIEALLLDDLEELFVNPLPKIHYCYGAWQDGFRAMKDAGVQFHERDSYHLPFAKMVSKRWHTRIRWSDGRGRWRQRVAGLILQKFSSSKYHRAVLVPVHVSTRKIRKEYFQKCPLCHSLKKSTRSIRDEKFIAASFSHLLPRHDGCVSKSDRTTVRVHGPGFPSCQWWQETRV